MARKIDPYRNTGLRTGRNEECPCGSGKKFKKCCLIKQRRAVVACGGVVDPGTTAAQAEMEKPARTNQVIELDLAGSFRIGGCRLDRDGYSLQIIKGGSQ